MTKDEALKLALSTLDEVRSETFRLMRNGQKLYAEEKVWSTIIAIKEALAQPDAYGYASRLAVAIWEQHYKDVAPQWKPLDDLMGVLTQIDNMTAGLTRLAQPEQKPVAWVYPEGLDALKAGKPWTAYGTRQEPNNTALYLSPQPDIPPYAWVTFTPYGDEDDVWYENPEGQLLEGWTYKPLYDTTPPQRTWVGLTDEEISQLIGNQIGFNSWCGWEHEYTRAVEAKIKEKNR